GPFRRNMTFFFTDYQGRGDGRGDVTRATIPTMDFRQGDLRLSTTTIYDPLTGRPDGTGRMPFPDKQIPESRISPIARKILSFIPPPTLSGFSTNYERATVREKDTHSGDLKIDHQFRERDTLMYRYSVQRSRIFDPGLYGLYGGPKSGGFAGQGTQLSQNTALNYTHIFDERTIAEFRFGVMRYRNDARNQDSGRNTAEEIGIRGVNLDWWTSGLTSINVDGYSNPIVGFAASLPWIRAETNFNWVSNWTKVLSNHTLKVGADVRRNRDDLLQTQTYNPRGLFIFRAGPTALNGDPRTSFANSFAAFLLDQPNEFGRDLAGIFPTFRQTQVFAYFQDKWQVTPKLTLDMGLRYELYLPPSTVHRAGFSNYIPSNNTLELAGVGSIPWNLGLQTDFKNLAPRFGLAYRLARGTVIRGGYGITVDPTYPDDKWAFAFPVKQNNAFFAENSFRAAGSMAGGFPPPIYASIPDNGIISPAPGGNYLHIPKNLRQGYLQAWNVTVQQALPQKFALEAGYVANHALGVLINVNVNAGMIPGLGAAGQPLNQRFGRRETTNVWTPFGSHYQSLQIKLDRRFSEGLVLTTAYTFGKAINFADDNGSLYVHAVPALNRGRSGHDRTHSLVSGFVYELPFGRGKRWAQTGAARWVLGDWQISGTFSSLTGLPLSLTYSAATLNAPGNGNRPNVDGKPEIYGGVGRGVKWLDVTRFSAPPPNTFGNVGRNILTGPGLVNLDFAVFRRFPVIGERITGELRMESFNFTNTPHFNNPIGDFGSASFGEVTSAMADQRSFQFALKLVF
ncbi:MAG: TonB-dependent receptor, partial [Bryobacterales bacterium]|nr:TonB-dependent receptor [Bryobacterales bacterium]